VVELVEYEQEFLGAEGAGFLCNLTAFLSLRHAPRIFQNFPEMGIWLGDNLGVAA